VVRRIFWAKHEKICTSGEAVLLLFSILAVLYPLLSLRLSHQIITRDEDVYASSSHLYCLGFCCSAAIHFSIVSL
jgi:hypothetical protein